MATISHACRAAAARVLLATPASELATKRRGSRSWCSAEATHSAERLSERAGSGSTCTGSSRARRERRRSSRWLPSAMPVVLPQHACFSPLQRRSWLPSGVGVGHGALSRLDTRQRGLANVQAQDRRAPAAAEHVLSDGGQADGYHQPCLLCCRSTRASRHFSVAAGYQAAWESAMVLCRG